MLAVWSGQVPGCILGVFGINKGSKWVQLRITCPVWSHTRLIMMSFTKNSPIGSIRQAKKCLKIAMLAVWSGPVPDCFGCVWDQQRIQMSPATHHICLAWIHTRLKMMSFTNFKLLVWWDTGQNLTRTFHTVYVGRASSMLFWVCLGSTKDPNDSIYASHVQYGSIQDW